ncbi:MAG: hypothetical protein RML36_00410 [Anaerolineae bacterium]|nr:hypothetical protein [Anaerolineae bacterium]MDW8097927.1 hypothetical protein [Anaerolineae bacterium]
MRFPKSFAVLNVVVVLALLLTSCGPAVLPTAVTEEEGFILALPRITLSFDAQGSPSVVGLKLEELRPLLRTYAGVDIDLSLLRIDPFWVSWMTNANVQHIEIQYGAGGVLLFVNGKLLPHLAWSEDSFSNLFTAAESAMVQVPWTGMVKAFLPFVRRTGIGLVLMFPKLEGVAEIPVREPGVVPEVTPSEVPPSVIFKADVAYDDTGVPTLRGLGYSSREMAEMTGIPALRMVELPPALIEQMKALNIQHVEIRARNSGIFLYINGMEMPHLAWNDALLADTASLYAQMNPGSPLIDLVNFLLPSMAQVDIDLIARFPLAEGASAIPLAPRS